VSVLEDFAKALGCREDTLFAMLRYVGDRSASAHYTVVAGWLAPVNLWEQMEIDWRLVLAKYDVPHFHMKEFAHSVGSFAKWRGQRNLSMGTRQWVHEFSVEAPPLHALATTTLKSPLKPSASR
jgi:hypothetical protein